MTFEEIAVELGITRQRVEQIYATAIAKMRRGLKREKLTAEALGMRDFNEAKEDEKT